MGLLIPEVFIILLTDLLGILLLLYTAPAAYKILRMWDIDSSSPLQYELEKKRLLTSVIVKFIFLLKIPLFLFFIYTNDKLSNVLTGAMCATGSLNATPYGMSLLLLKIVNIFLMSVWLTIYQSSNTSEKLPAAKKQYSLLLFITLLSIIEGGAGLLNFANLDPTAVVSCCSSIYSSTTEGGSFLMSIKPFTAFLVFIMFSVLYITSLLMRNPKATASLAVVFFMTGIANLILFTSTYIYQLPSHKCPFCILQKEYYYIGYLFYISLFLSASSGLNLFFYKTITGAYSRKLHFTAIIFGILFMFLSVLYPFRYFLINNQWL
ncbi:MAG: hypothetical protein C0602_12580 [Denitrovibrio sp.]|mgnify:CR=1 FL=1|nr:MAG: hypothetical protein C0602_12580 [Denitrovibrio sp.]